MTGDHEAADSHGGTRTLGARFDVFDGTMALAAVAGGAALVWLGLGLTFFWDEWEFIASRSLGDPGSWIRPHNEHWSTLPILVYRSLVETVGLSSYLPYHAVLVAIHLGVALAVYLLLKRSSGPWVAIAGGVLVLLFGSGFENLFWAFQIGFVLSTASCLAALLILDGAPTRHRALLLLALVLAGLASSGLGLATAVVIGVEMLLQPRWRQHAWILAVAAGTFAAWFVLVGRSGLGVQGNPLSLASLLNVPVTVLEGIASSAGGLTGLGPLIGIVPGLVVFVLAARQAVRRTLPVRTAACLLGIVALYFVVGLARTAQPQGPGNAPRLTYLSGPLLLIAVGAMVGRPSWPAGGGYRRPVALACVVAIVAVTASWNLALLVLGRDVFVQRADITRALVTVELAPANRGRYDPSRPLAIVPSGNVLAEIVARYGSPLHDAIATVPPISARALAKAEAYVLDGGPIPVP